MNNFAGMDTFYSKFSLPPTTDVIDERRMEKALVPQHEVERSRSSPSRLSLALPSPSLLV